MAINDKAVEMFTETIVKDVLIIGAGLSGIGAAVHLQKNCPTKSYAILEGRERVGGTWDLFRYPGIRSDSDMYTLGYKFKPWTNPKSIADGESIRNYICEAAQENNIEKNICFQHKVTAANWNSKKSRWILTVEQLETAKRVTYESQFLICCSGYYNYENGFTPEFKGRENFKGDIVHPQQWPEGLDYSGKKVVIIGSGATAITLIPSMTDLAAHVTMLQRSPSYVASVPEKDIISNTLRQYIPEKWVYHSARIRNILLGIGVYNVSKNFPNKMRKMLIGHVKKRVGTDFDMKHFNPKYSPWDERLCAAPDGDLFKELKSGRASIVTSTIECFTQNGIRLSSGEELEADLIITATGLEVQIMGGVELTLDSQPVDIHSKLYYKGTMLEDVPNVAMVFGYTNSSWTLKADLISEYFCRVINYMDKHDYQQCTPRNYDADMQREPFINISAGYIQRAMSKLPQQGGKKPWKLYQNYIKDYYAFRFKPIHDSALTFTNPGGRSQ